MSHDVMFNHPDDTLVVCFQPAVMVALLAAPIPELQDIDGMDAIVMACILHLLWTHRDWMDETIMSYRAMDEHLRIGADRAKRLADTLVAAGVLTRRRVTFDSPYAYTVHPDVLCEPVES